MVRLPYTAQFDVERRQFELRFSCEDCGHFDARDGRCRHEWPNEQHRQRALEAEPRVLDFCKEFELC